MAEEALAKTSNEVAVDMLAIVLLAEGLFIFCVNVLMSVCVIAGLDVVRGVNVVVTASYNRDLRAAVVLDI